MRGTIARHVRNGATRLTSITRRQTSGASSQVGALPPVMPALLTRMSMRPRAAMAASAAAATAVSSVSSTRRVSTRPAVDSASRPARAAARRCPRARRSAPDASMRSAIAWPIPCAPPVTTATAAGEVDAVHRAILGRQALQRACAVGRRQSAMYCRMIDAKSGSACSPSRAARSARRAGRPVRDDAGDPRVGDEAHAVAGRAAGDGLERVEHLGDAHVDRGQVQREARRRTRRASPRRRRSVLRRSAPGTSADATSTGSPGRSPVRRRAARG